MLDLRIKKTLLQKARELAPADTWNLRLNAMSGNKWSNKEKFIIRYSTSDAYYVEHLEEGQWAGGVEGKPNLNKDFILDTTHSLERMLINYFRKNMKLPKSAFTRSETRTNARREYVHKKSLAMAKAFREENNNGN
jgi:hypothetical protein